MYLKEGNILKLVLYVIESAVCYYVTNHPEME